MKKLLLIGCLLLACISPFAQFLYHKDSTEVLAGTYADLGNNGQPITIDYLDNVIDSNAAGSVWSALQQIGFAFHFNRQTFNYLRLNTDGFIILDSNAAGTNMGYVLTQIEPFRFAFQAGGANAYRIYTSGPEGAKVCTIQFKGIKDRNPGVDRIFESINFQIKLHQATGYIEFVYGDFTASPGAVMDNPYIAEVGLTADYYQKIKFSKNADTAWQRAAARGFDYFYFRKSVLPVSGTTYRFKPRYLDVEVKAIYALGKQPVPAGSPALIQVRVKNNHATTVPECGVSFSSLPYYPSDSLQSRTFALSPNADTVINLYYRPTLFAPTQFSVSTYLNDDNSANNYLSGSQEITTNLFSHADDAPASAGFTHAGLALAAYQMQGTAAVDKVRVYIASGSIGTAVYAVVVNASGVIVAQSASRNITAADTGTYMQFDIPNPPSITDDTFYAGLAQSGNVAIGVQAEYPARPGAFYTAATAGGTLTEVINGGKFMIQAGLKMNSNNDLSVEAVYGLKKVPLRFQGSAGYTGVKVKNNSHVTVNNLPVTLTVDGVATFSVTNLAPSIAPGDSAYVYFNQYFPGEQGSKTLRFSIPDDADNSNNSKLLAQVFTDSVYSYVDTVGALLSAGFGTGSGILMASFTASYQIPSRIKAVRVHISNDPANVGKTVRGVFYYPYGYGLNYSDPYIIQPADLGQYKTFRFNNPWNTPLDLVDYYPLAQFSVGLEQIGDGVTPYYPVSYMPFTAANECYQFDFRLLNYYSPDPFPDGQLLIEAIAEPAKPGTAYIVGPGETRPAAVELAGWRFDTGNSPASAFATVFNSALLSSSEITRGPGAPAGAGNTYFQTTGFGNDGIATTNTDYFEVKLTPIPGKHLKLTAIGFDTKSDSAFGASPGVLSQFAYSLNGLDFTLINTPIRTIPALDTFPSYSDGATYVDLSELPDLQRIASGTSVTFRYYASGQTTDGHWGFGSRGLSIYGLNANVILVDPVKPAGADFTFTDCNNALPGSVHFEVLGAVAPGNVFEAMLVRIRQDRNMYEYLDDVQAVGTLTTDSTAGTIQFSIPNFITDGEYYIRISNRLNGGASTLSKPFYIKHGLPCSVPGSFFVSARSGKWNDVSTWQHGDPQSNYFIPATHLPTNPTNVYIRATDTVVVDQPAVFESLTVKGKLVLTSGAGSNGSLGCYPVYYDERIFGEPRFRIDSGGVFQVVSHNVPFDSMIYNGGIGSLMEVKANGKVTIGDGSANNGPGLHRFVQSGQSYAESVQYIFRDRAIFEWNTTSSVFSLPMNIAYFTPVNSYYIRNFYDQTDLEVAHPILRLTKLSPGNLGSGADSIWVNGFVDVQTPITLGGTGRKVFRDGITGNASITQSDGAGQLLVQSPTRNILVSPYTGTRTGLVSGNVQFQLNGAGLVFDQGITITNQSSIALHGAALSNSNFTLEPAARLLIDTASSLTIRNGNLANDGVLDGTGRILFTGANRSTIRSASTLQPALELNNKQLSLASTIHTTGSVKLADNSRLQLGAYNLQMDSAALIADASNFIVTNDTGMLSRMVVSDSLLFPVGADNTTYSPLTLASVGDAGKSFSVRVKVGVLTGGLTGLTIDSSYVNRSWVIQKSDTTSSNASIQLQWPAGAEQPGFNRSIAFISQLTNCGALPDCNGVYYDEDTRQQAVGNDPYALSRSNINRFSNNNGPAIFVVQSGPIVFRFTGNGDWNNPANWTHGVVPPLIIPRGMEVIVSPATGGSCIVNGDITVLQGGKLTLTPGSTMEVRH